MASQNSNPKSHNLLMPVGVSKKRKEWDVFDANRAPLATKHEPAPPTLAQQSSKPAGGGGNNRLLAGYLAHEFLTKGTLFGQRWDPTAAASKPAVPAPRQPEAKEPQPPLLPKQQRHQKQQTQMQQQKQKQEKASETKQGKPPPAYADVAYLLKTDGAHVPGVVNPTQLARWLQM